MSVTLHLRHGDCVSVLREYPEGSIGAIVSDPPYGLEFMGKEWDKLQGTPTKARRAKWEDGGGFTAPGIGERDTPWPSFSALSKHGTANPTCAVCSGRLRGAKKCGCPQPHDNWKPIGKRKNPENEGLPDHLTGGGLPDHLTGGGMTGHLVAMQEWHRAWLVECYRVLVPGGVVKAFSATRTFHRMAAAMEAAGFTDTHLEAWNYATGFPKSHAVDKGIAKRAGGALSAREAIEWMASERKRRGLSRIELERLIFGRSDGNVRNWEDSISLPRPGVWPLIRSALGHETTPYDAGMERGDEIVGAENGSFGYQATGERWEQERILRQPRTDAARTWEGWGTALKPSWEPVLVGTKPYAP